jgi:ABC-2 type transport system ATP-binding protein
VRDGAAALASAAMIHATGLTKRYGAKTAVDGLSFRVRPGVVTGFLGPNGAGKSTTMRMILGLDAPTAGDVTVGGRRYCDLPAPLHEVGALLEARAIHGGRSAYDHLLALAHTHGIARRRVEEVLALVGLTSVGRRRAGTFSLGMGQRLGIAAALLGDPAVLLLDEPVNGLDTDGVRWIRGLLRDLAAGERTILVSSHLLAELHRMADHVVVLGRGRLLADCPVAELVTPSGVVVLRTPDVAAVPAFRLAAGRSGYEVAVADAGSPGELTVRGATAAAVGDLAHEHGMRVHGLAEPAVTLEDGYLRLVADDVEYPARPGPPGGQGTSVAPTASAASVASTASTGGR